MEVSHCLISLGRLRESLTPCRINFEMRIKLNDIANAGRALSYLSEKLYLLGELDDAQSTAQKGVGISDQSGSKFEMLFSRTALAEILFAKGHYKEAGKYYLEAEALQRQHEPSFPLLYSQRGYRYCEFLLAMSRWPEALRHAEQILGWRDSSDSLFMVAFELLTMGKAKLFQLLAQKGGGRSALLSEALTWLDQAVEAFRKAGVNHHLPKALLARASCRRFTGEYETAQKDLMEMLEICSMSEMVVDEINFRLEMALLLEVQSKKADADDHRRIAQTLADKTGFKPFPTPLIRI